MIAGQAAGGISSPLNGNLLTKVGTTFLLTTTNLLTTNLLTTNLNYHRSESIDLILDS